MSLPPNFNRWSHLRSVLIQTQNRIVRAAFSDIGGDDWSPEITTGRGSLRHACTLQVTDSATVANIRLHLFYNVLGQGQSEPWMGLPIPEVNARMSGRPLVTLVFYEDWDDVAEGYQPVKGELSFRLRNETATSITEGELRSLALRIRSTFGAGRGYIWRRGKSIASYHDQENGYQLQILCRNSTDARSLITDVLSLQNVMPDWTKLNFKENQSESEAFPTIPGTQIILGKSLRKPRRRPIAEVRFRYAWALVPGYPTPVSLVDMTGTRKGTLVAS